MASTSFLEEMECTDRCRSVQHGREVCAIGTQGSDIQVLSLWKRTCMRFYKTRDEFGRAAVHIAASTGRPKVVEWLVKREGCDPNLKDTVSGYTPLHRSIYFGHLDVARALIRLDASLTVGDNEGYYPLDLCQLNSKRTVSEEELVRDPNEVYVWGGNENYNLGTGSEQPRSCPELLDKSKKLPWGNFGNCFVQVAMERYHTIFLHWSHEVFSCGFGVGGRLGLGTEFTTFTPTKIDLGKDVECIKVAVGPDHTLFLLSNGTVKSCGANENFVLGHTHVVNKVLRPKPVDLNAVVKDIAASRIHSAFLTDEEIYVCGMNVGQMGRIDSVDKVVKPSKVVFPFDIDPKSGRPGQKGIFTLVACNETATAVAHSAGNIWVLKNYDCITINARHVNVEKIQLVGGVCNFSREKGGEMESQSASKLTLFALIKTGRLLIWREGAEQMQQQQKALGKSVIAPHFNLAVFNIGRALTIRDFCANINSIVLISNMGEAFKASFSPTVAPVCYPNVNSSSKSAGSKAVNQWNYVIQHSARHYAGKDPFSNIMLEHLKLRRIPNIYNAIKAFSDPRGNNFAITRRYQKADQFALPLILPSEMNTDFGALLREVAVDDLIHDVVFQVKNSIYPAHLFVIASRSKNFYDQIRKDLRVQEEGVPPRVVLKGWEPRVLEQILQFLYTNNCDILISGNFHTSSGDPDWLELVKLQARKLGLVELQKRLKEVYLENDFYFCKSKKSYPVKDVKFSLSDYSELLDVDLVSDDGFRVKVHLCVIVARLEYFKSMLLSQFWLEGNRKINELKFPGTKVVMDIFLPMMYDGRIQFSNSGSKKDLEVLSQALVASDLLLSQQYRSQIESLLVESINMDTVSEILQLADFCNASQIKEACMEFISLNIAPLLENRCLESVPDDMMADVALYYRRSFTDLESRKIRDTTAPPTEIYEAAEEAMSELFVDLENICDSEFVAPRKGQGSKPKVKLQARNRNPSVCSNQDLDLTEPSSPLYVDGDDLEDLSDSENSPPQYKEKFTLVSKINKHSPRVVTSAKDSFSQATPRTTAVIIPSKKKLPFIPDEQLTPLPRREPPMIKTAESYPPPSLQLSDFPSFEDSCKSPPSKEGMRVEVGNKDQVEKKASSVEVNRTTAAASNRKKTKWKSLDDATSGGTTPQTPLAVSESSSGRDPRNPWQKHTTSPKSSEEKGMNGNLSLGDIVRQEERKKENLRKALDKPLHFSQIEDQAINQLLKRYTTEDVENGYELLTVERVSCGDEYAIPVWRKVGDNPVD